MRIALLTLLLAAQIFCRDAPSNPILRFDGEPFVYQGLGASVYLHDDQNLEIIERLGMRWIRVEPSPNWAYYGGDIPANMTSDEFRAFAARKFSGEWRVYARRLAAFHRALEKRKIKVVWVMYQLPFKWLIGKERNRLSPRHRDDFLKLWMAQLLYYRDMGITPYMVEMANEPDGWWNGRMTAEDYHELVTGFRRRLNGNGLRKVKIGGPGLSSLSLYHDNDEWIGDMPDRAFASLDFITMHGWDEVQHPGAGLNFLRGQWQPFKKALTRRDPTRSRRLIMTEFSTEVVRFGKRSHFSPRSRALYSAMESPDFALRIIANALVHVNQGIAVPMFWRLSDHPMDRTSWGLIAAKPRRYIRPALHYLEKMITSLPPGSRIHPAQGERPDHLAMLLSSHAGLRTLRAVNMSSKTETVKFRTTQPVTRCACRMLVGKGRPTCRVLKEGVVELQSPPRGGLRCELR